jgi:hypothetical protein
VRENVVGNNSLANLFKVAVVPGRKKSFEKISPETKKGKDHKNESGRKKRKKSKRAKGKKRLKKKLGDKKTEQEDRHKDKPA